MPEDEIELFPGAGVRSTDPPTAPPTVSPPPPPPDRSLDYPNATPERSAADSRGPVQSSHRHWGAQNSPDPSRNDQSSNDQSSSDQSSGDQSSSHQSSNHQDSREHDGALLGGGRVTKAFDDHLRDESPWIVGSAALLVALTAYWVSSILAALQHSPGTTAQDRILSLLVPGSFVWAAGALLAVVLFNAGSKFQLGPSQPGLVRTHLPQALLAACLTSAVAASLDVLVELTNFGHGIDRALSGLVGYSGVIVLSGATTWWAHREHESSRV